MTALVYPNQDTLFTGPAPGALIKPDRPKPDRYSAILGDDNEIWTSNAYLLTESVTEPGLGSITVSAMFDDFYNRIHVSPGLIDMGNVISGQFFKVYVWNGYEVDKAMTAHVPTTEQGVNLEGQGAPYTMSAYEELTYELTVDASGPPNLYSTATWTIGGEELSLTVSGTRIVDFLYKPNWKYGVSETYSWLTDIIVSFSGSEQRRSLRIKPRRTLEYRMMLTNDDLRNFQNKLYGWQNRPFAVPLWQDKTRLTTRAKVGDTQLSLDTTLRGFAKGGLAAIRKSVKEFEIVEIADLSDASIILSRSLVDSWDVGTEVYPAVVAYIEDQLRTRRVSSNVMDATVRFNTDPVSHKPALPDESATITFEGYEVVLKKPNWAKPIDYESDYPYLDFDSETGARATEVSVDAPTLRRKMKWLLKNKSEIWEFKALMARMKGRRKVALVPTWFPDMVVTDLTAAQSTAVTVNSEGYSRFVGVAPGQEYMMVRLPGGGLTTHRITGVVGVLNDRVTLSFTPKTEVVIPEGSIVSLMHLCRFSSDDIEINHDTDGVAEVQVIMESKKA